MKNEELLLLGLLAYALWFRSETAVSLPTGANLPMTGNPREVPRVPTPLDPNGFPALFNSALQVLERGLSLDFGPGHSPVPPPPDPEYDLAARVFAMQAAFESADGKSVYHFNLGNLTTTAGDFYLNPPTDARHQYAVFLYPLQGAVAMIDRVKRLWPDAYRAAFSGAVTAFVHALKPEGKPQYFEADEPVYRNGMLARGKLFGWDSGVAGVAGKRLPPRVTIARSRRVS